MQGMVKSKCRICSQAEAGAGLEFSHPRVTSEFWTHPIDMFNQKKKDTPFKSQNNENDMHMSFESFFFFGMNFETSTWKHSTRPNITKWPAGAPSRFLLFSSFLCMRTGQVTFQSPSLCLLCSSSYLGSCMAHCASFWSSRGVIFLILFSNRATPHIWVEKPISRRGSSTYAKYFHSWLHWHVLKPLLLMTGLVFVND